MGPGSIFTHPLGSCKSVGPNIRQHLRVWKVLRFQVAIRDRDFIQLLHDFRLMTNKVIRFGILNNCSSLGTISRGIYHALRAEHNVYSQHVSQACSVGVSILRNHRRRVEHGLKSSRPFVKRLFVRIENQAYALDRTNGLLRFPVRAGQHVTVQLRRRIHSQLEYKARWRGIPLVRVNPKNTSRTCPACGSLSSRKGGVFEGEMFRCGCGWSIDRQTNAALNILNTAIACHKALARAVRFQRGAMRHDVVILRPPPKVGLEMSRTL